MVEQPCHCDPLLLSSRKHIIPIIHSIEPILSLLDIIKFNPTEQFSDLVIASGNYVLRMGVDDLISECAGREIWSLWDVEQSIHVRSFENSTCKWP